MTEQARSGPYYYKREDFAPARRPVGLVTVLVFLAVMSHAGAIYFGMWLQRNVDARERARVSLLAKPASVRENPRLQLQCTKADIAEFREACKRRAASL